MRLKQKAILLATVFSLAIAGDIIAQCSKTWVRKKCIPKISPFIHNGQMNTVTLKEGGKTETTLTFYSGQDYRILVCAEETLENVSFVVSGRSGIGLEWNWGRPCSGVDLRVTLRCDDVIRPAPRSDNNP